MQIFKIVQCRFVFINGVYAAKSKEKDAISDFYKNVGLDSEVIANAVLYAVSQPDNIDVPNLVVQPTMEN